MPPGGGTQKARINGPGGGVLVVAIYSVFASGLTLYIASGEYLAIDSIPLSSIIFTNKYPLSENSTAVGVPISVASLLTISVTFSALVISTFGFMNVLLLMVVSFVGC